MKRSRRRFRRATLHPLSGWSADPPDDKADKPDLDRVNIREPNELRGWCAYWNCTPAELKEAVQDVGVMAANVEAQLTAKGHKRKESA